MDGMRSLTCAQHVTLWSTYAVTNWRNGVEELPRGEDAKLKTMTPNEILLKKAGAEVALVLLFVASVVEGVARSAIDLISLAFKACSAQEGEFTYIKNRFLSDLSTNMIFIPSSIIAMLGYNISDEQIGPVRCYEKLRKDYCGCLPQYN